MTGRGSARAIAGLILAGGRSQRMGGVSKALLDLAGKPLIQHVIDRLSPQVESLALSVERERIEFQGLRLPQVPDPVPGHHGPLGGLLAALNWLRLEGNATWLVQVPCDAPFLPRGLAVQLRDRAVAASAPAAVIRDHSGLQPAFAIWHLELLPALEKAVNVDGMSGFKQFIAVNPVAELEWPADDRQASDSAEELPPFFNINDRVALARAEHMLREVNGRENHAECK